MHFNKRLLDSPGFHRRGLQGNLGLAWPVLALAGLIYLLPRSPSAEEGDSFVVLSPVAHSWPF